MYTVLRYNGIEYKARLELKECLALEHKLGENPVNVILTANESKLPKIKDMLTIIHYSLLKYQHGITFEDVQKAWEDSGADIYKLIIDTVQVLKDSGWLKDEEDNN